MHVVHAWALEDCVMVVNETCRFLDPAIRGEYPREMREILGKDLPPVPYELEKLKPSIDFIGVNHYTSYFVKDCIHSECEPGLGSTRTEGYALTWAHINGMTIGKPVCIYSFSRLKSMHLQFEK